MIILIVLLVYLISASILYIFCKTVKGRDLNEDDYCIILIPLVNSITIIVIVVMAIHDYRHNIADFFIRVLKI